jgi:threonine aldolase
MRQAGILAAAGLYAIERHVKRLADDHAHAKLLARALNEIPGIRVDLSRVETNIVIADVREHPLGDGGIVERMAREGILFLAIGAGRLRLVTHLDVSRAQVEEACAALKRGLS